jgi:hypothetical protein
MTIFIEQKNGFSMRQVRDTPSGVQRIIAVVCLLFLVLPGVVLAATPDTTIAPNGTSVPTTPVPTVFLVNENTTGTELNVTSVPTTPVPTVFLVYGTTTMSVNPPPLLIFDTPVIKNLTPTLYGIVSPGSVNVTIVSLLWDWGDMQTPEYHGFPNSHVYSSPGTYTLSITARQSDG